MMPGTLSIITDAFPAHERGKAMGTWAGVSALALAIGPVLGGFLTEHVSWRAIFYINIPVGIASIVMTKMYIFDPPYLKAESRRVDYWGIGMLAVGIGALALAVVALLGDRVLLVHGLEGLVGGALVDVREGGPEESLAALTVVSGVLRQRGEGAPRVVVASGGHINGTGCAGTRSAVKGE